MIERIKEIVMLKEGGSYSAFAEKIGVRQNTFSQYMNEKRSLSLDVVAKTAMTYPDINIDWLITGDGSMLKADSKEGNSVSIFKPEDLPKQVGKLYRAPVYKSYPVSAGDMGLSAVRDEKPDGYAYTAMPGVVFFPVVGCSFEPIIKAGHYIGTVKVDSWDRVDTEKIYFIVTSEERMIKRLRVEEEDKEYLWCVSPNFREFKILKSDIVEISHVFFYGMMI